MQADETEVTPEQARAQLAASRPAGLGSSRDRRVHAIGTTVLGLAMGLFMASRNLVSETGLAIVAVVFIIAWIAGVGWVERAAGTVPRGARRWSRVGIAGSLIVAMFAVLPRLNLQAQTEPNTLPMVLLGALVVAVPSVLAAAVIAGYRRMGAADERHARHELDAEIHAPVRFRLVAALDEVDGAEFGLVRDAIEVTDSVLSKQSSRLEAAGYLKVRKGYVGKRPRTWLSLTPSGREAYRRHLGALRTIADGV